MKLMVRGCVLPICFSLAPVGAAAAAETVAPDPAKLDAVVVIGDKRPRESTQGLVGSLDAITRSELVNEHVDDTSELFSKVPGLYVARYNQGLINSELAIRGFAGDGETPHAKLLIDGIPSNLHNGFGEMDGLFPIGIDAIRVFKGTSDPTVGLFNIAGNYRIDSRSDVDVRELEATVGSFDTRELQGYLGFRHGRFSQAYAFGHRENSGYREHTDLRKRALSGRWEYAYDDGSIAMIARISDYVGDAPGYLTREEARRAPRSSAAYANQDGGDKNTRHVSMHFDHRFGGGVSLSAKAWWQHFERERWVRFSQASALQNRYDDQRQRGLSASVAWDVSQLWRFEAGIDAEFQDVIEQRFGTFGQARRRNPVAVLRDRAHDFDTTGAFARIGMRDGDRYGWNVALRADRIDGDYAQFSASGVRSNRDIYRFGTVLQPKFNAFVGFGEQWQLFANAGRTFQHPFSADAYTAGDRSARDVSINDGWEAGARWRPSDRVEVRLSYWEQRAKDEFVVVDGTARNVGRTEREGIDLAFNAMLSERWSLWGNYTIVDARIARPADNRLAFVGNRLRSVPRSTGSLGLRLDATDTISARLHVDHQGDYPVNEANLGGNYGGFTLAHASIDWRLSNVTLGLQATNLFDRRYEYVFDQSENGSGTIHSPGDGRAFSVSARYEW
jgi:iron complex outermembrane receptor protein